MVVFLAAGVKTESLSIIFRQRSVPNAIALVLDASFVLSSKNAALDSRQVSLEAGRKLDEEIDSGVAPKRASAAPVSICAPKSSNGASQCGT